MVSEIILIYQLEQIDVLLSHFSREKLRAGKLSIIALKYEVELSLKRHGIPYHSLQKYLKPDSFYNLHYKAARFLRKLYESPEMDFFQYSGIRLGEVKGSYIFYYIKAILYHLETLDCIFNAYPNINKLWIPQSDLSMSDADEPITSFTFRSLADVVMFLGKKRGISISVLPYNKQQSTDKRMRSVVRRGMTILFEQVLKIFNSIIPLIRPPPGVKNICD